MSRGAHADNGPVTRSLGLPLVLLTLLVGGYLFVKQADTTGPTAQAVTQAETEAVANVAATNFQGADTALQAWYATNGTYAGAELPPGSEVTLARADATSYCIESGSGTTLAHENGPNGPVQPGPC
jgi:hypothetical protein